MITEDHVSFETAKLLKEKGFDVPITSVWIDHFKLVGCSASISIYPNEKNLNGTTGSLKDIYTSAPTLQMTMKWLREVHKLHIDVDPSEGDWNPTVLELEDWTCAVKFGDNIPIQDSYEEACEAAIKYCLENLI